MRVGAVGISDTAAGTDLIISGAGTLTASVGALGFNAGTHTITVASTIADNGPTAVGVAQNGGTTIFTGTNTYTGVTAVNVGTLQIGSGAAAGINWAPVRCRSHSRSILPAF